MPRQDGCTFATAVKLHKLVKVSQATKGDAAFARQVRRKYLRRKNSLVL
jgi:hypothetical protein